jgi:GNAT superfamily N-acetyltransferase
VPASTATATATDATPEPLSTRARRLQARVSEPVRLRDGSLVAVRAARTDDEPALRSFLDGLCLEARRMRFFSAASDLTYAAHLGSATGADRYGLVAHDEAGVLVGHATYVQLNARHAEVAVEVSDDLHGRGLGTILIERLAEVAEGHGITYFVAEVLCENRAMLDVFREGFDARVVLQEGPEERVEFLTSGWRLARERFHQESRSPDRAPGGVPHPKNSSAVS